MTYWPISAPTVFAASKRRVSKSRNTTSDDGVRGDSSGPNDTNLQSDEYGNPSVDQHPSEIGPDTGEETTLAGSNRHRVGQQHAPETNLSGELISFRVTRNGQMIATITHSTLTIWQTKPTAVLASVLRSDHSLKTYGPNVSLLVRPDSNVFVVQTLYGFLITYLLSSDPTARVYRLQVGNSGAGDHSRKHSVSGFKFRPGSDFNAGPGEGDGIREVNLRFRMVIRVDAGISMALALDEELMVATQKPAAMQCIRWSPDSGGGQTSTELLSHMDWLEKKASIEDMVHDRPMNLSTWVTSDGKAYAVQKIRQDASADPKKPRALFKGYAFHHPKDEREFGSKAAINARFSLIAVGCADGDIFVYTVRDYMGNVPLSHKLDSSLVSLNPGKLVILLFSPDGYCLFAGYEHGWMMWSVYGKPLASSFSSDVQFSQQNDEQWLLGVLDAAWIGSGSQLILLPPGDNRLWMIEMARSAVAGCFSSSNVSRSLLQTSTGFLVYRGYDVPDMTAISTDASLWHHVQIPGSYLADQWPIRSAIISADGRYVAVAGRRGLAHYSVLSGRWKTFDDPAMENDFTVRGGMCWHGHVLIAAVESNRSHEIRLYSREVDLDNDKVMHVEGLAAPIIMIAPSGVDSLLVYTQENILHHYIINTANSTVKLVQVGQIALHGIIRAPPRVRAISWILPEHQMQSGDPSQDVAVASVLFLVDGKLVLLQPATNDAGELKYEMRIIAQNTEYYVLMRDHPSFTLEMRDEASPASPSAAPMGGYKGYDLRDSLWHFDGRDVRVWNDVQEVLRAATTETGRDMPETVVIPLDFYPLSALLSKGILFGIENEFVQRRDINFAFCRFLTRTHLFIPPLLRYHLAHYDPPAALHLSQYYAHLAYFPHALEVLLHNVLDDEAESRPPADQALLPGVLSFLSSFPHYLDVIVQCTRKTEVRSWRTLFEHLPSPQELFEESLQREALKTAGGYLLVLQTFDGLAANSDQLIRLLRRAKEELDYDLCKELARFLMALDESGDMLREALATVGLGTGQVSGTVSSRTSPAADETYKATGLGIITEPSSRRSSSTTQHGNRAGADYFSAAHTSD